MSHGTTGTHYAHCLTDGHHSRWPYVNYSEDWLDIKSTYEDGMSSVYIDVYQYAQVAWNSQGTRVRRYGSLTAQHPNLWETYSWPDPYDGLTIVHCNHGSSLHETISADVALNRWNLDGQSLAVKRVVAMHELGHQSSLGHSTQTHDYPLAVMWYVARNTPGPYSFPQPDDVCGVNVIYRSNTYPPTPCHADHSIPP